MPIQRFIDQQKPDFDVNKYSAGIVIQYGDGYSIGYQQNGADETFSIGQPVYDKDGNLMGYMGIGLFNNLDYDRKDVRVPCEHWSILMPTKFCERGKNVVTYWQLKLREEQKDVL